MTRGKGIYDDEKQETEHPTEVDPDKDTPDVSKDADEPTA